MFLVRFYLLSTANYSKICVVVVDRGYVDYSWLGDFLVHFWDSTTGNEYHFLTNNTKWKASLVANIYKQRWHIEVFFKHLKQRLKVSTFLGTSENAVMIQIWTSLIGILLLKYLQKKAKYDWNLSNLVAFIRMNIFVKINIWQWIDDPFLRPPIKGKKGQLKIFAD
ncbi:transposase [Sphingobacterium thalpophilum]|uniref:transposase n=1 Tax=Sphingobacterium thalpophilum TaxID=259 RepID=UPI0024A69019|nr:transposase [Sphingobacterium thalpophilum]